MGRPDAWFVVFVAGLLVACGTPTLKPQSTAVSETAAPAADVEVAPEEGVLRRIDLAVWPEALAWSPDGKTLALVDGDLIRTLMPERQWRLPKMSDEGYSPSWWSVRWRPDGKAILVGGPSGSALVRIEDGSVLQRFAEGRRAWWIGDTLCTATDQDAVNSPKTLVQRWTMGGTQRKLPTGFTLGAVSRNGLAMILQKNGDDSRDEHGGLYLLVLDGKGNTRWSKPLYTCGRLDLRGELDVDWNPHFETAVRTVDTSGGGTMRALADTRDREFALELVEERGTSWGGEARWIDDRHALAFLSMSHSYQVDAKTRLSVGCNRLALFDAKTHGIRPIYDSPSMVDAVGSGSYVAIVEMRDKRFRVIVTEWKRTDSGEILTTRYQPDDADVSVTEGGERWRSWLESPVPPLQGVRSR